MRVLPQLAKRALELTAVMHHVNHSDIVVRILFEIAAGITNTILGMIPAFGLGGIQAELPVISLGV